MNTTKILVPAYQYPNPARNWDLVVSAAKVMRREMIVVANSANGHAVDPVTGDYLDPDPHYVTAIRRVKSECSQVIGYVFDCYGNTGTDGLCPRENLNVVLDDVARWYEVYDVDGIFVDQVNKDAARGVELVTGIRARDPNATIVLNLGSIPDERYVDAVAPAIVLIQEQTFDYFGSQFPSDAWVATRQGDTGGVDSGRLAIIGHSGHAVSDLEKVLTAAKRYRIGWVYGQHLSGPIYNEISAHLPELAQRLDPCRSAAPWNRLLCRLKRQLACRLPLLALPRLSLRNRSNGA